jgi:3-deoxy-manno-octulosonate cytidylyltransferase (CMP-KDO synthetase)
MKKAIALIPARYASSRFPGKPLADIKGKSMIMRVYEQALKATLLKDVFVATDDDRIFNHVTQHGGRAIMTSVQHKSGTERCQEAYGILLSKNKCSKEEIILNIQGDEPFVHPGQIDSLVRMFDRPQVSIATLIKALEDPDELRNPNCVKVVFGSQKQAIYFSRASIPFIRDLDKATEQNANRFFKHVGMYAYRSSTLTEICKLPPSPLELAEKLEQLRWLENGYPIHVEITEHESIAIDSPADLLKVTNTA